MHHSALALAAFFAFASSLAAAQSADPNLPRNIAANCANCHGTNGHGVRAACLRSRAGQSGEVVRKLREFRAAKHAVDDHDAAREGLHRRQIDLAAGFFAAQKP